MMWHDETLNGNSSRRVANSPELKRRGQPSTVPEDVHNVTMFPSYRCIIRGIHINTHIWFATQNPVWNWSLKALKVKVRRTNSYTAESTVGFKLTLARNQESLGSHQDESSTQILPVKPTAHQWSSRQHRSVTPKCLHDGRSTYLKPNGDSLGIDLSRNFNRSYVDICSDAR